MNGLERFALKDKVILLTGGAGIYGRGLATDIASAGATLIIASRNLEANEAVAREEREAGFQVVAETLDQGNEESIEESIVALSESMRRRFGRVDGLVNNSVARPMLGPDAPAFRGDDVLAKERKHSQYWLDSRDGWPLAKPLSGNGHGCRGSGLLHPQRRDGKSHPLLRRTIWAVWGASELPFAGRLSPWTILGIRRALFMLSDAARYVTGANLPVDGGYTAR